MFLYAVFPKVDRSEESSGTLVKKTALGPHSRPADLESSGMWPRQLYF